jgi:hypothetical protein
VQLAFLSVKLTGALWQPKGIMLAHSWLVSIEALQCRSGRNSGVGSPCH